MFYVISYPAENTQILISFYWKPPRNLREELSLRNGNDGKHYHGKYVLISA